MRKCLLVVALVGMLASVGYGADAELSVTGMKGYPWRGMTVNDGFVIQPYLDVSAENGVSVSVWGNYDVDDYDGAYKSSDFSEVDLYLTYAFEAKGFDMTVGLIHYLFPHQATEELGAVNGVQEVTASISRSLTEGLSVTLTGNYEYDEINDYYASLALAYGTALTEKLSLETSGTVGIIGADMSAGGVSGLNEYNLTATLSLAATDSLSISGLVGYTDAIDTDVLPYQDVDWYGAVSVAQAF